MKIILHILVSLSVSTYSLYAQDRTIKGRVISNNFDTMPGVSILINDSIAIGQTDIDGYFNIDVPISAKKILFGSVGLDTVAIDLLDNCDSIEVVMMLTPSDCFMTLKKSERLRRKRFKNLPKIHKEAFKNGLFKTEKACYTQS